MATSIEESEGTSPRQRREIVLAAVGTTDGVTVNEHFGRSSRFDIYELHDGIWRFREQRGARRICAGGRHDEASIESLAALLSDCSAVVVEQIGPGAVDALIAQRVLPFVLSGEIELALTTLLHQKQFRFAV